MCVVVKEKDKAKESNKATANADESLPKEHEVTTDGERRVPDRELSRQWSWLLSREPRKEDRSESILTVGQGRSYGDNEAGIVKLKVAIALTVQLPGSFRKMKWDGY